MSVNRKYLVAVASLAVLAVVFGLAGTVARVPEYVSPHEASSPDSVTHFMNPPAFDSGWVNITDKCGQYFDVTHDLNTTDVFVDYAGKTVNLTEEDWHQFWSMGDVNRDGYIDTTDYDLLIAAFGTSDPDADLNEDGIVDIADLDIWMGNNGLDIWAFFHAGIHQRYLGLTCYTLGWSRTYGGANTDGAYSVVLTSDGGYALAGGKGGDFWLVKTEVENGLAWTSLTTYTITLYRGKTDPYWNYVRVRIWSIKEPTWQFGDINQDGVVDAKDLAIIGQNYGKTFSALSLGGIIAIAGIYVCKKRKQPKEATTSPLFSPS